MEAKISPRFCKIILCDNIRIPKKFTQRYGQILPDTVFLKVPGGGALWEVELVRNDDGEIWLEEKGWKEFKDHYHIGFGHYLVFKFDTEFSHFKVCIFDMESVEIDYPVDHSIDDSVVFLGRFSESQKDKEKIVEHCSPEEMTCRKRPNADDLLGNPVRKSARKMDLGGDNHTENTDIYEDGVPRQGGGSSIGTRALGFTKQLKTCNAYMLPLPKGFAEGTGISCLKTGSEVMLRNEHGKKWLVNLNVAGRACGIYNIGAGWNKFLTENKITIGNTLSFTFVSDNIIEVRVVKMVTNRGCTTRGSKKFAEIDHPVDHSIDDSVVFLEEISKSQKGKEKIVEHCSTVQMTGNKRPKTGDLLGNPARKSARKMKLGGDYHTENTDINEHSFPRQGGGPRTSGFTKQLMIYNAYMLTLPKEFVKGMEIRHMTTERKVMLQNEHGNKWTAKLNIADRASSIYNLNAGWNKFLTDNNVTVGSTLSFNFVSSSDNTIEVRVVKMVRNKDMLFKYVKSRRGKYQMIASHENTENDVNHAGRTHSFSVEMKNHHASQLGFPQEFVRSTGISASEKVMLKDGKGSEWPVFVRKESAGRIWMSRGWTNFLKGKKVFEGDRISFKFIPNSGNVIEAHVQKCPRKGKPLFSTITKGRGRPPMNDTCL